jgi:hypothetical protein
MLDVFISGKQIKELYQYYIAEELLHKDDKRNKYDPPFEDRELILRVDDTLPDPRFVDAGFNDEDFDEGTSLYTIDKE